MTDEELLDLITVEEVIVVLRKLTTYTLLTEQAVEAGLV